MDHGVFVLRGTRAQRLAPEGTASWGSTGAAVGEPNAVGPATIVFDTPATWVLVQRAKKADADHLLAGRFDAKAQPLWESSADIGVPGSMHRAERIEVTALQDGDGVRVEIPSGLVGSRAKAADITTDGNVRPAAP